MSNTYAERRPLPAIDLKGVSKVFSIGGRNVQALREVNLSINKGEFVCLIGASGCGKSTLLRIMAGFETASSGSASMYGMPIAGPGPERGMVFQDYGLFPWLTVKENIGFGQRQRNLPKARLDEISAYYTDMVGLTKFADYYPGQLSGGMKQRVSIARVLANAAAGFAGNLGAHQADRRVRHARSRRSGADVGPGGGDDCRSGAHRRRHQAGTRAAARYYRNRVQPGPARHHPIP
jgi:predicted ABC-type transport system involved in lysophospholipase L1 biosynthesis ATPase subunit